MTPIELYLLLKLDAVIELIEGLSIGCWLMALLSLVLFPITEGKILNYKKTWIGSMVGIGLLSLVFSSISTIIPTTKEMCVIIVAPKILNNEKINRLPNKVVDLADAWLNELKPKEKK